MLNYFRLNKIKNNQGFTLFESLLSLFVNTLILLLIGLTFQTLQGFQQNVHTDKNIEWHLFLNQMENDLTDKTLSLRTKQQLDFDENGTKNEIKYEWKHNEIIRKKNNAGYVPMLTKIREVTYRDTQMKKSVDIEIHFSNGQILKGMVPVEKKDKQ